MHHSHNLQREHSKLTHQSPLSILPLVALIYIPFLFAGTILSSPSPSSINLHPLPRDSKYVIPDVGEWKSIGKDSIADSDNPVPLQPLSRMALRTYDNLNGTMA